MRGDPITVVLASPRPLDRLALATLVEHWPACCLLAAEATLEATAAQCRRFSPHAALVDLGFPGDDVFGLAARLSREGLVRAIGLLDIDFAYYRAKRTLAIPHAAYFTRCDGFDSICEKLRAMSHGGMPGPSESIDPQAFFPSLSQDEQRMLARLTAREEQLLVWLAQGYSVKRAAEKMGLAESTVDNHKWRLMKKLQVQRMTHLTRLAIRAGLIE